MTRRRFLAATGIAGAAGIAGCAFGPNASAVELSRHDVPVPGLPDGLAGLKVAHISDVHLPANHRAAERAIEIIAAEKPEVVIITGDITERESALGQMVTFARSARGSMATFAVRGNWEIAAGIAPATLREAWASAGVTYLQNESSILKVGNTSLAIAGLDDPVLGRPDVGKVKNLDGAEMIIWAMHGPGFADTMPATTAANLLLAGHTHGGQIRLPFIPALRPSGSGRFLAGWYETAAAPLYVSRGVGTTDIRARFRCPPEVPVFTLRKAGMV